jgi:hypothetical protein
VNFRDQRVNLPDYLAVGRDVYAALFLRTLPAAASQAALLRLADVSLPNGA